MDKHNEGFALPAVLLLLTLAGLLALSVSTLSNNQVRMAGNLRASVMSMNAAEAGAAFVVNGFVTGDLEWLDDGEYEGHALLASGAGLPVASPQLPNHGEGASAWWVESLDFSGDEVTARIHGIALGRETQRTVEVILERGEASSDSPFAAAVVGCEGVDLSGSGTIDSWDSRNGAYSPGLAAMNANVGTLTNFSDIIIRGNSPIRGSVLAGRDVRVSGSSTVAGDYRAVRNIVFNGNPSCPAAEVKAGGYVQVPGAWWRNGCGGGGEWEEDADVQLPQQTCDPLNAQLMIADSMDAYRPPVSAFTSWPHAGWRPNPVVIEQNVAYGPGNVRIGPGAHPVTVDALATDWIYVDGDFSLTSSSQLHFWNPSAVGAPQHVRVFVEGDFETSGASRLNIDPGVSVTVYATGRINFGGGHSQTIAPVVEAGGEIRPTLSIYTSFSGNNGVRVTGSAPLSASIYAPYSDVSVTGSGALYGAVRGRTVSVSGAGGIHYDEALGLMSGGGGGSDGVPRIAGWREVR